MHCHPLLTLIAVLAFAGGLSASPATHAQERAGDLPASSAATPSLQPSPAPSAGERPAAVESAVLNTPSGGGDRSAGGLFAGTPAASWDGLKGRAKAIKEIEIEGDASLIGVASPIGVLFKESPGLSKLVAADLLQRGVPVTVDVGASKTEFTLSARLTMSGPAGRIFFSYGPMFEKLMAAKSPDDPAKVDPALNLASAVASYGVSKGLERVGLFNSFLFDYYNVLTLSDLLGVRAAVNKALTGDARGVCLVNCTHWNDTYHWIIIDATVIQQGVEKRARVAAKMFLAQIDPQTAFDIAYEALLRDRLLAGAK